MLRLREAAVVAVAALLLAACGSSTSGPGSSIQSGTHTVVFSAQTSDAATMDVTYGLGGDTSQASGVASPWSHTAKSNSSFIVAVLEVQTHGTGTVTCKITKDGKLLKQNSSSGQFSIATCSS